MIADQGCRDRRLQLLVTPNGSYELLKFGIVQCGCCAMFNWSSGDGTSLQDVYSCDHRGLWYVVQCKLFFFHHILTQHECFQLFLINTSVMTKLNLTIFSKCLELAFFKNYVHWFACVLSQSKKMCFLTKLTLACRSMEMKKQYFFFNFHRM